MASGRNGTTGAGAGACTAMVCPSSKRSLGRQAAPLNLHMPLPDPGTQAGAGMLGQQLSQNLIQALPRQRGRNGEGITEGIG